MKTTLIAVGGGGFNLAADLIKTNVFQCADFIVCATDENMLAERAESACAIYTLMKLRGKAKSTDKCFVKEIIAKSSDTVVVCSTLGGMSGSYYAPLVALGAITSGKIVCSIVTLPFEFEGEGRKNRAYDALFRSIAASHFTVVQNNNGLNAMTDSNLGNMNRPIVDYMTEALKSHTLQEFSEIMDENTLNKFIPASYLVCESPLLWIRSNQYRGASCEEREKAFDSF